MPDTLETPFRVNMRVLIIPAGIADMPLDAVTRNVESGSIAAMPRSSSIFVIDGKKTARQFTRTDDGRYRDAVAYLVPSDPALEKLLVETRQSEDVLKTLSKALKEQMRSGTEDKQKALRQHLTQFIPRQAKELPHATS